MVGSGGRANGYDRAFEQSNGDIFSESLSYRAALALAFPPPPNVVLPLIRVDAADKPLAALA